MAEPRPDARLRSPLGRAIGLGSAKEGVEHWWAQRVTSIALVPLTLWFVIAAIGLAGAPREAVIAWLKNPIDAALAILLLAAAFYHTALGLQVVIEDYVHREGVRLGLQIAMRLLCVALAVLGILAVLQMAFAA